MAIADTAAFVFALQWRHLLEGEHFEAITNHIALRWLMNLELLHFRMAKWIVEVMTMTFTILHAAGNGDLLSVPDALSRDFVEGSVLCPRCLEMIAEVEEEPVVESEADAMRAAQRKEFGNLTSYSKSTT
jgi:RNase H-like domain found in reverse transcriptase